ncbi:MAG: RNA-binding protein [Archaeoglobus sp.]|nr:MAG: RNA-binding protein [Archaeoglobus sp.]
MCESKVFLKTGNGEKIVMEDVIRIEVEGNKLKLYSIFGDFKEINGRIVLMDMSSHRVVVEGGE